MSSKIDKELLAKRQKLRADHEHSSESYKNYWKIFLIRPRNWLIFSVSIIICLGIYYDWNLKIMINVVFSHLITAILTGLIEYFILNKK